MATIPEISVDFDAGPFEAPSTWTELVRTSGAKRARSMSLQVGRSHELDLTQAGRFDALLDNRDRALDPDNTGGTYYPNVRPMRHIRARVDLGGTTYNLYSGFVEDWGQAWSRDGTADAAVPLKAIDGFKLLNLAKVAGTRFTLGLYTDAVDSAVTGASAAHWYMDEPAGAGTVESRVGNFDFTSIGTNVTIGAAERPPTYGRPRSVSFGTANSDGNGLSRTSGPEFVAGQLTSAWMCWLRLDSLATDGYVAGLRTTGSGPPRMLWRMNASGDGIFTWVRDQTPFTLVDVTQSSVFLDDGEWHHYALRISIVPGGSGTGSISVIFIRDGSTLGTQAYNAVSGDNIPDPSSFNVDLLFAGGDGGLGGNHGIDGNMAQLVMIQNNAPSTNDLHDLGNPVFDYIPEEPAGLQLHSILDGVGWPLSPRSIDDGTRDMVQIAFSPGDEVLSTMQQIAETSERGLMFFDAGGTFVFWDADTLAARVSQGTFGDSSSEVQYAALQTRHDDQDIRNQIAVFDGNGGTSYVEDGTSIGTEGTAGGYGPHYYPLTTSLASTADRATIAADLLAAYKDPHTRPVSMELVAVDDTAKLVQMFARQPGDRVTILRRPPDPDGGTATFDAIIEGKRLEVDKHGVWTAVFDLAPNV